VKDLAGSTADSTEQIAATITELQGTAARMTGTIRAMVEGVDGIGAAGGVLRGVAVEQYATVERLTGRVQQTLERIADMSALAERLERRHTERIAATGPVAIAVDGGAGTASGRLLDLSRGGLRCCTATDGPVRTGDTVTVELTVDGEPLRLHAQVVHCLQGTDETEVGMQFLAPPAAAVAAIQRHVGST
jgi:hypothetical protein